MKKRMTTGLIVIFIICFLGLSGCSQKAEKGIAANTVKLNLGELIDEYDGNGNAVLNNYSSESEMLSQMTKACENEKFELYFMPDSMTVAIKDKESSKIIATNPFDAAANSEYSGTIASEMDSQLVLTYLSEEKNLVNMYSSVDCANLGQYKVKTYQNGISFDMSVGKEKDKESIPTVLTPERYKKICSSISKDLVERIEAYFTFFKKDELDKSGILDVYPDFEKQDIYYCSSELSDRERNNLSKVFDEAKYSSEDFENDAKELKLGASANVYPNFKLSLSYVLTDDGLIVSIPNESIEYEKAYPLLRISLLPYFGADSPSDTADGYLFIPDGSGAVINMNQNVPERRSVITGKVYGENLSELPKTDAVERTEQYYLPVFGTVRNNSTALFGSIVSGDSNSEITAHLAKSNGNFYSVNPEFILADYEQFTRVSVVETSWSTKTMYLYDKNTGADDFTVKYSFLKDEQANYSYMAELYGNSLFDSKSDKTQKAETLHLETIGSALTTMNTLGFEHDEEVVFTGYRQNTELLTQLEEKGVSDVSLLLRGAQKGGLDAPVSNGITFSKALGGTREFKKLFKYCIERKINCSLDNNISFAASDTSYDGFTPKNNAVRTLELHYAEYAELSPDTMLYSNGSYVVSPTAYQKYVNRILSDAKKISAESENISLGNAGKALSADYSKNSLINRYQAKAYICKMLSGTQSSSFQFDGANAYVLPYAGCVNGISLENSGFSGESAFVPFLQMALGGKVKVNSKAVNLMSDVHSELLRCIESGTIPTFLLSYDNTSQLKNTRHTKYYSVDYSILEDTVINSYKYMEDVIKKTQGSFVKQHEILSDGITVSTYENGVRVYVNHTKNEYSADDITIPALSYAVKE